MPCPSRDAVRRVKNVKRRQSGDMCLRWTAAGMLEAERQFRRIIGHCDLVKLARAVERDVAAKRTADASAAHVHTPVATAAPEVAASPT
jgi:putative transposase